MKFKKMILTWFALMILSFVLLIGFDMSLKLTELLGVWAFVECFKTGDNNGRS